MPAGTRLLGRTALVTGAGSGLGRATALAFAAQGANVVFADIDGDTAGAAADRALAAGGAAAAAQVDVTDRASVSATARWARERFGPVDVLFHSAGIAGDGSVWNTAPATWDRIIAVNLTGTFNVASAVVPDMMELQRGSVIFVASVGGLVGVPGIAPYAASKGGVVALARQMAVDLASRQVRVNAICPGTVPTPLVINSYVDRGELDVARADEQLAAAARRRYPMGRLGTPADVADLAIFLASDESSWLTGVSVPVDGGLSAAGWLPGA